MSTSETRYFSVAEANRTIPALERHFGRILQMRVQLRSTYQLLEQHGEAPTAESLGRLDGPPELRSARARFVGLMEALKEEVRAVDEIGVQVKDLDTGLCDFYCRRGGRDVFLCWRYGEKEIGAWHELTTGFAGRQPLGEGEGEDEGARASPRILH